MDNLDRFTAQIRTHIFGLAFANNLLIIGWWLIAQFVFGLSGGVLVVVVIAVPLILTIIVPVIVTNYFVEPMRLVWQAILYIAPDTTNVPVPDASKLRFGQELVTTLVTHVYQIAHVVDTIEQTNSKPNLNTNFIASSLPLPLVVLDAADNVVFANEVMLRYIGRSAEEVIGQNAYAAFDVSFMNEHTLDVWLQTAKAHKVTDTNTWERVRLNMPDGHQFKLLDMAAYYNRDNSQGLETMILFFDRTEQYSQDEQAMSFISLAVHELRTPLTLLRGYIEVFEEELHGKLNDELEGFLNKMHAASQQLAAFTNNILNVSRFENDQLILKLHEERLADIVAAAVNDMRLRASVQGVQLTLHVAASLPTVGADRVSIYEVLNNLIDNAIKYSGDGKEVVISVYVNKEGNVETTVQDFGVGIQASALANLFEKFYRNHRSRASVSGTGMGLYLSKTMVEAQDGEIWVKSKEGRGSIFGFTLKPFSQLARLDLENGTSDNKDIVRSPHGWIKNHSLYRR